MIEEISTTERRKQEVQVIKKIVGSDQRGRGAYLPGLWACRLAAGLTQQELAEQAGTGRSTVRSLEAKERRAHATTIRRLSEALEVEPVDLICGEPGEG